MQRSKKLWLSVLLSLATSCASPTSATRSESGPDISAYWPEVEWRMAAFHKDNPTCPDDWVHPIVILRNEFPENPGDVCEYNGRTHVISAPESYRSTEWGHGCMPHELAHAAYEQAGNPCWRKIGHGPGGI